MAYVLGFMFADGSLLDTNDSSRTYYLQFSNNNLPLLENIRTLMKSDHPIYIRKAHVMKHKLKEYQAKTSYVFKFGNKSMYNDLLLLGITHRKSNTMRLPHVPSEYFSFFLRGYFDGDGCISATLLHGRKTPRLRVIFTSGSEQFLTELSLMIAGYIKINTPRYYRSTGAFNLMLSDFSAYKVLKFIYSQLNNAPYLERKYLKYLDYENILMGPRVRKAVSLS